MLARFVPRVLLPASELVTPGWERPVGYWLAGSAGMLTGMVMIGGYTRLTGSGLSMTDWSLAGRSLPRGSGWEQEFEEYKKYPEYLKLHAGRMSLSEFKGIYFVEWFHRMFGRATGFVFLTPLAGFIYMGALRRPLLHRLCALGSMGLAQGLIGWWMVKSGLNPALLDEDRPPRVSSVRMAFHWLMALGLYGGTMWMSWSLLLARPKVSVSILNKIRSASTVPAICALATLSSGPFVAGIDAGRTYNTWPKMLDRWIPEEVSEIGKNPKKIITDTAVVQFVHRCLAYSTVLSAGIFGVFSSRLVKQGLLGAAVRLVPALAIGQMCLGITTLLMYVPTELGVAHQAGGLAVFTSLLLVRFLTRS